MSSERAKELRQRGIAAVKAGQNELARQFLQQAIRLEPGNEAGWIWLASIARDRRERLFCFQKLLEINPRNETALKVLQQMGLTVEQVLGEEQPPELLAQTTGELPRPAIQPAPRPPGAPMPDPQKIEAAQARVDQILREYRRADEANSDLVWTHKTRRRAGERDTLYLRVYVLAGILGVLLIVGLIGTAAILSNPRLRGIVFAPTWTPSFTPSVTPTNTPGFTPTPSPTPELTLTPSPTIPPEIPQGDINAPPAPTRIYPAIDNRIIGDAAVLINQRQYSVALPTLEAERELTTNSFNPAPYYYEALALIGAGNPSRALRTMQEAEQRLSERPNESFKPLVDTGLAQVFLALAQASFRERRGEDAVTYLDQVQLRAEASIALDPRLAQAYLTLADSYLLRSNYDDALQVLNDGLAVSQLTTHTGLIVKRGEVYFEQGEIELAAQEAYLALYIDPTIEDAYLLQIRTALAKEDPGLAVIYAQRYLFFYPGSVAGYKLLGDARLEEGNTDLALAAYDQALAAENPMPATVDTLVARAQIYKQQKRYDQARLDLTRAFNLSDDPSIQAQRMQAAYLAGNTGVALDDAETLAGSGALPDAEIQFLKARILIDEASPRDTAAFAEALTLLDESAGNLAENDQPIANEYRARALFYSGEFDAALTNIDAALNSGETGSRHFLRGEILEALERPDDAAREYEWVVTWSQVYPYPFLPEARQRLEALR